MTSFPGARLVPTPSLADCIARAGAELDELVLTIHERESDAPATADRRHLLLSDGNAVVEWHVTSLRELWRGDEPAPSQAKVTENGYLPFLFAVESQVLLFAEVEKRVPYDDEIMEVYRALRCRPDGGSLSSLHDHLWQAVAFALGILPTSEAEYGALMARLERSARHWRSHATSRGYCGFIARLSVRPVPR
jgi:hypothetical protein